jgi:hypothetical protein
MRIDALLGLAQLDAAQQAVDELLAVPSQQMWVNRGFSA